MLRFYTGELAASYAPDLKLVGVAAAAPATYLIELFDADKSSPAGKKLTAMAQREELNAGGLNLS
jgi:hypothetical protein